MKPGLPYGPLATEKPLKTWSASRIAVTTSFPTGLSSFACVTVRRDAISPSETTSHWRKPKKLPKIMLNHTFDSAARALRTIFADSIAKTWDQYDKQQRREGFWLNSHSAALLVLEQVHGLNWRATHPDAFRDAAIALGEIIPELFADYWLTVEP